MVICEVCGEQYDNETIPVICCTLKKMTAWHYEDELPKGYPYDLEFPRSRVVNGVRMFPPHICDWQKSLDGGTEICKCGAWR